MRLLIYSGFDPRLPDNFGYNALHLACLSGNLVSVEDLCEKVSFFLMFKYICVEFSNALYIWISKMHLQIINFIKVFVQYVIICFCII